MCEIGEEAHLEKDFIVTTCAIAIAIAITITHTQANSHSHHNSNSSRAFQNHQFFIFL
jgi:hypothetical protein